MFSEFMAQETRIGSVGHVKCSSSVIHEPSSGPSLLGVLFNLHLDRPFNAKATTGSINKYLRAGL